MTPADPGDTLNVIQSFHAHMVLTRSAVTGAWPQALVLAIGLTQLMILVFYVCTSDRKESSILAKGDENRALESFPDLCALTSLV